MANGYGVGLFDSKGPEDFAAAVDKIVKSLTGVKEAFSGFGTSSATAIQTISSAIDTLTGKLSNLQTQVQSVTQAMGAARGAGGGGGMGNGAQPGAATGQGSGGTGAAGTGTGIWLPPSARDGFAGNSLNGMQQDTASSQNPSTMTKQPVPTGTGQDAVAKQQAKQTPQQGGGFNWSSVGALVSGAAGTADKFMQGPGASMVSTAVQGATIGQMLGPAFGVNPRSLYVIPGGTLAQNAGDYAQANYYAMMNMGVAPGTQNWSTVQRGANQLMTLVPGMSRQGAMGAQNALQQPGVLNRALAVGLNLRPGGQLQTPEQQYQQIFNRLTMGGQVNAKTFAAMMQPGAPGAVNLEAIGIAPGTDAYYGFMQYAYTRLGQQAKGANMPDVGTSKGASQAGLNTPYYAQLQAQSAKSQLESRAEPGIAEAAKNLNEAAASLLRLVNPLGSLIGGGIGGISKLLNPFGMLKSLTGGMFQAGGLVPGPLNEAMLAIVHGGEQILPTGMFGGGGGLGGGFGGLGGMGSVGGLLGGLGGLLGKLFGGLGKLGGGAGFSGGGSQGGVNLHIPSIARLIPGMLGVDKFFENIGGDIGGAWHRGESDVHNWLKDIPGLGALFGGSVFGAGKGLASRIGGDITGFGRRIGGDIGGVWHRGESDIHNWLKDIPGLGALFGGSVFGAGKGLADRFGRDVRGWFGEGEGMVKGIGHKAGGLFSHLFHGAEHLGSRALHGIGGALGGLFGGHKGAKDSALDMLTEKLTDIKGTALYDLLTPVSKDSVLAAITGAAAAPKAPAGPQQAAPAPKQAKQSTPDQHPAAHHKKGRGGILGGIEGFLGNVGGNIASLFTGGPLAGPIGLGPMMGIGPGGFPGSATPAPGPGTPYAWSYTRPAATIASYMGLFNVTGNQQSSDGSQTSSSSSGGSGGTGAGAATNLNGSGNVQQAYNFFISKGLKDFQSAGIVGNLAQESGVNPGSSSPGAFGVAQWTPPDALYAWAKAQNRDPKQLATQLDFLWSQISPGGSEAGTLPALQGTTDAASAAQSFESTYERAGIPMMQNRIKYAQNILNSKGAGYARGTQLIARNQLAMLHRGEAVVTAADNYSTNPYNKGGAGGGTSTVHLNFKAGAIVLQVPPNATQNDMDDIANKFVKAVSKSQLLAGSRSS